jgi:hypothetical protein
MRKHTRPENRVQQGKAVAITRTALVIRGGGLVCSSILATACLGGDRSLPTEATQDRSVAVGRQGSGFKTTKPAYLVPLELGVTVDPILSTGDIVGDIGGVYQMSGLPDGLGAYKTGGTIQLFMNHELDRTFPPPPFNNGSDARVSQLTLNPQTRGVIQGSYPLTGNENLTRFCSSTLAKLGGTHWYLTGEETITSGHFGSSIALNAETGLWVETPHFGKMQHENVVPLEGLSRAVLITTDDDFNTNVPSYLYAYIANSKKFEDAIANDDGDLYVWRADDPAATPAAMTDGQSIDGHFVPVSDAAAVASPAALKAESASKNAARFIRLEDAAAAPKQKGRFYFADTGKTPSYDPRGRIYQVQVDKHDPTRARLTLLLSGGQGDDIYNPDNLEASEHSLVIQEDRNSEFRDAAFSGGYGRVLVYDLDRGTLRAVARVNTPPPLRPGTWESSGVINAEKLLGKDWWLVDVQAHEVLAPQPGPTLAPNSASGEDGQLLAIKIPNS